MAPITLYHREKAPITAETHRDFERLVHQGYSVDPNGSEHIGHEEKDEKIEQLYSEIAGLKRQINGEDGGDPETANGKPRFGKKSAA